MEETVKYEDIKEGDVIRVPVINGTKNHLLMFQDGFTMDLSDFVTVRLKEGVLYAGGVSLLSYKPKLKILKQLT